MPKTAVTSSSNAATLLSRLERRIAGYGSVLIAFSGGVDSAVLLAAAHRALGSRALALTADSPSIPREEIDGAKRVAHFIGVEHLVVRTDELDLQAYVANDGNRCYWCKQTLFSTCGRIAASRQIEVIAYGFNADDVGDHRPGQRAATERGISTPLLDAGLGKQEIRAIARHLGLEVAEKPAAPCLASRIPYGSRVTEAKLQQIEQMEMLLHDLGFDVCRARFDGRLMRIEVESHRLGELLAGDSRGRVLQKAKELDVPLVTIDLEGFRSGKLNHEVLQ